MTLTSSIRRAKWVAGITTIAFVFFFQSPPIHSAPLTAKLVPIATDASDPANLADTEPSIAINPKNPQQIAVLTFSEGWDPEGGTQPEQMAPIWKSQDGGKTWKKVRQIPCPCKGFDGPADQKIGYDDEGRLILVERTMGGKPPRCYLYRQPDNNSDAPLVPGSSFGFDQPLLDFNNSVGSNCSKLLFCSYLDYTRHEYYQAGVAVSDDYGKSVNAKQVGDDSFSHGTARVATGPKEMAYLLYKTREGGNIEGFEKAHFWVLSSSDCGQNWSKPVCAHGTETVRTFRSTMNHQFGEKDKGKTAWATQSDAWIATNPDDGRVHVVFVKKDETGKGQLYHTSSTDKGKTWKAFSRLTDGMNHSAYPSIAVAKTGAVGVLYVDYDPSKRMTAFRHRFARSFDAGATWTDQILQELDPNILDNASSFLWGDYQGLTAHNSTFYGVFTGQSIGRTKLQLDPIFFTESAAK